MSEQIEERLPATKSASMVLALSYLISWNGLAPSGLERNTKSDSTTPTYPDDGMSFAPFPNPSPDWSQDDPAHPGFVINGLDDTPGQKAYYIHMEAKPGKEELLQGFLRDINAVFDK
jgi:hypothetical protein